MIDVQPYIDKLETLKDKMALFINEVAYSYQWHLRVIADIPIPFPKNYQWIGHDDNIELSDETWDKHPKQGWSKPDKIFGGVELRYLWKQFHPKK